MQEILRNISPIKQRILQYLETKGITKYKFYADTGVGRNLLDKKSELSQTTLKRIFAYYSDLSPIWVYEGRGEMIVKESSSNEKYEVKDTSIELQVYESILNQKEKIIQDLTRENILLRNEIKRLTREKLGYNTTIHKSDQAAEP
jgi:hypothetical protein